MTEQRPRKRARTSTKSKGAAPTRRPTFRLIALALALLAACAYAFYYLDHLPEAEIVRPSESWKADPGEQLRLQGLEAGTALSFTLREPGALRLSFGAGTIWRDDPAGGTRERTAPHGFEFSLFNVSPENIQGTVMLFATSPDARPTLIIEPVRPDRRYLALAISSPDAPMTVDFGIMLDPEANEHGRIVEGSGAGDSNERRLHDARLVVPPGVTMRIGMPASQLGGLILETGNMEGFEIGSAPDNDFERRAMVCGADRGRLLWQHILPGIRIGDCRPGRMEVESLRLGDGIDLAARGTGFTIRDGATTTWRGFRDFRQNDVVKALISALIVALIGWVIFVVRRRISQ